MISLSFLRPILAALPLLILPYQLKAQDVQELYGLYQAEIEEAYALNAYEIEGVWTVNQAGRERYEELRNLGAQCSSLGRGLMRCKRFLSAGQLPETLRQRVERRYQDSFLEMEAATGVEILFKGEDVEEYLVTQLGRVSLASEVFEFEQWRYFYASSGLEKIQAGLSNPTPFGFVRTPAGAELIKQESLTLGREHFQVWLIALPFNKSL